MIDLAGVREVQARISELQAQFGLPGNVPGMNFAKTLRQEIKKQTAIKETAATKPSVPVEKAKAADKVYSANASLPLADESLSSLITNAAKKYQVDPKLVSAVAEVESGGRQEATSAAGAVGVMQLMPDTAASLGVNPYDKRENVEGGAKYLKEMLDLFGGDVKKAVAAYNAGPAAVKNYGGVPPYKETQNYVNKVLDIYR